ncbi:hypothetical protein AA313_de0204304 [Arthrobotrys entomopaga]|nr:hypothetical protein AA313_de0204304 [Arthrobotrys entomopaga]
MLHPSVFDGHGFFYPIGNTPALNLAAHLPPEIDADVLLLGCGDLRHILFTLFTESHAKQSNPAININRKYHFTCCDLDGGVIARNVLLLSLIVQNDSPKDIWPIYYDVFLAESSFALLRTRVKELLELCQSIEVWSASPLGRSITIGSAKTLSTLEEIWSSWDKVLVNKTNSDKLTQTFRAGLKDTRLNRHGQSSVMSVARSAGPLAFMVLLPSIKHFEHYWQTGTTENLPQSEKYPNPTFGFSKFGDKFSVHYGSNPLAGFHLSTTITPFSTNGVTYSPLDLKTEDFAPLVKAAKTEFTLWCEVYRRIHKANTSSICVFIDDALELCASLHHRSSAGATGAEKIAQADALSKGYYFNHPSQWNVIDISNLIDHLGIYNIFLSVLPLLRQDFISHLNTESLLTTEFNSEHAEEALNKVLGVDPRSIFSLFGIAPIDFLVSHTGISQVSDSLLHMFDMVKIGGTKQIHGRLVWKYLWPLEPNGNYLDQLKDFKFKFVYEPDSMNLFLTAIYKKLFEIENHSGMLALIQKDAGAALAKALQHNSRATFSLILRRIKTVTSDLVGWDDMIEKLMSTVAYNAGCLIASCYLQEQDVLNYLHGLNTVSYLKEDPINAAREFGPTRGLRLSPAVTGASGPVTCLTLAVPIGAFRNLLTGTIDQVGTPILHLRLSCGPLLNNFGSIRRRFGKLQSEARQPGTGINVQPGAPNFEEDSAGWNGSGDVLFSCMVPTWFIYLDGCAVSVNIVSTPQTMHLMKLYGFEMEIFRSSLKDSKRVRLSTDFPSPQRALENILKNLDINQEKNNSSDSIVQKGLGISGLWQSSTTLSNSSTDLSDQSNPTLNLKFLVSRNPKIEWISYRWDVGSDEELLKLLDTKAPITTARVGTSTLSIYLGTRFHTIHFPYPVGDSTKLSIARKSKYIEIDAPLVHQRDTPLHLRFPFGISNGPSNFVNTWSLHRFNLDKSPPIFIDYKKYTRNQYEWINTTLTLMLSDTERKALTASSSENVLYKGELLAEMKESIHSIIIQYAGLQGHHTSIFGLCNEQQGGNYMLIFIKELRMDLSGQGIVADCALIPLEYQTVDTVASLIHNLTSKRGLVSVRTSDSETKAWLQFSVGLVERCRTWSHDPAKCEYYKVKKIPLTAPELNVGRSPICSCGKGLFPKSFYSDERIKPLLPHATRAALGPLFPPPYSTKPQNLKELAKSNELMAKKSMEIRDASHKGTCGGCGGTKIVDDDKTLMKCARCKSIEYCSKECQKRDWKRHKAFCHSVEN